MSDESVTLYLSKDHDNSDGCFHLSVGPAKIIIDRLDVRVSANFSKPHVVNGRGGSEIMLTDTQLLHLVAEWLRFTLWENCEYQSNTLMFEFSCKMSKKEA